MDSLNDDFQNINLNPISLCGDCWQINFSALFDPDVEQMQLIPITVANAEKAETTCQFCSLLLREARHLTRSGRVIRQRNGQPLVFNLERECQTGMAGSGITEFTRTVILKVDLQPVPTPEDSEIRFNICPIFTDRGDDHVHCVQFISRDKIDLGMCSKWLRDCEIHHLSHCQDLGREIEKTPLPQGFRVIDTVDECIVLAPQNCRYIALSYVWGQVATLRLIEENIEELESPGSLARHRTSLSRTVQDAIHVVRSMGERYLWVDGLCIIQNSPQKAGQISNMDTIYGAALLTLVAAYGSDANAGLRGVRPGSRVFDQAAATIWHDLTLVAAAPSPGDITESVWATRGWTYQEQLLSQRLLVFTTDGQAVWQCTSSLLLEDGPSIIKTRPPRRLRQLRAGLRFNEPQSEPNQTLSPLPPLPPLPLHRPDAITEYVAVVEGYTKRRLTFVDDVLVAFQGFGSILQRRLNSGFLAGLPEAYLDQALLWTPSTKQERREGSKKQIPSWSWAGWSGHTHYEELDSKTERVVPVVKWYYKENGEGSKLINQIGIGIDESRFGEGRSSNTFFWLPIFELLAIQLDSLPTSNLSSPQRPLLQFWTSCSIFHIAPGDRLTASQRELSMDPPVKLHLTFGRQLSGYLILNGERLLELDQARHEFIVLSEAQFAGFNPITSACTPSDKSMMYNVMLIEWDDRREMASRLGIGRVLKQAWAASEPVIKFITLG